MRWLSICTFSLFLAGSWVTSAGCSWGSVVTQSEDQLSKWRLLPGHTPMHSFRWRLPPTARIRVASADDTLRHHQAGWARAAQRGLDTVFPGVPKDAPNFPLLVVWPANPDKGAADEATDNTTGLVATRSHSTTLDLLGLNLLRRIPRTDEVYIHLFTPDGQPVYQASMTLSPTLWGTQWQDPRFLEQAFFALAQDLKGD